MGQKTDQIFERGQSFLEKGNYEQALRLFNEVLNREPQYKEALKNKVLIKISEASKDEATKSLNFALDQLPQDDELQQIAGTFFINHQEFDKGLAHLRRSVQLNNKNALAHYGLGIVRANQQSDHQKAIEHFNKAIEVNPEFTEAFFNRGCSHLIVEQHEEAKRDLTAAKELGHPDVDELLEKYF